MNRGLGDPSGSSQRASAPLGAAIGGLGLQDPVDHLGHSVVLVGARTARTQLVMQALQTQFPIALALLADRHAPQAHTFGD